VADIGDAWVERPYGLPRPGAAPPAGAPAAEPHDALRSPHDEMTHFFNAIVDAGVSPVIAGGVRLMALAPLSVIMALTLSSNT
jgi:hypothetical protein